MRNEKSFDELEEELDKLRKENDALKKRLEYIKYMSTGLIHHELYKIMSEELTGGKQPRSL